MQKKDVICNKNNITSNIDNNQAAAVTSIAETENTNGNMASHHNPSQNIVALERTPETSPQNVTTAILADFKSNGGNDIGLIDINNGRKQSTPVSQDMNDGMILINHTGDLVVHERLGAQNKRRNDNANPITEMQGINIIVIYRNPHGNTIYIFCIHHL